MNKEYQSYLRSDDWKEKKAKKYKSMAKKKRKCGACGCIEKRPLHVHHLNYKNLVDVENDQGEPEYLLKHYK